MKKLNFIKYFEAFHEDKLKELISLNKAFMKRKIKDKIEYTDDYEKVIRKIITYDISKFNVDIKPYGVYITPDKDFLNIIEEINKFLETHIPLNFEFEFSINKNQLNLIDFEKGIPELLKGLGLGYKLYKRIINIFSFITTNKFSSKDAYNIWYNLMIDKDLYCFTSEFEAGVINKTASNDIIKDVLDNIRNKKLIFDDELTEKIIELYGSMDIYTQGNK